MFLWLVYHIYFHKPVHDKLSWAKLKRRADWKLLKTRFFKRWLNSLKKPAPRVLSCCHSRRSNELNVYTAIFVNFQLHKRSNIINERQKHLLVDRKSWQVRLLETLYIGIASPSKSDQEFMFIGNLFFSLAF